ncbi:MAG: ADP-L-glycero-D-mannoheptose-6-epimerase, partial [Bacteroidales bacterium]|nr:ADP-L-glycero-D-mannoheptose-6-epimerase [Bacteroidales bacterium]
MMNRKKSGIFNLGTGVASSYNSMAEACFEALNKKTNIEYIDTPIDIRNTYQYYTCADMRKLREAGYNKEFTSLNESINSYIKNYLINLKYE